MSLKESFTSLKLGIKLGMACGAVELVLLAFVLASMMMMSTNQLERYGRQREIEVRHLLSTTFADALVRKDSAEVNDIASRLLEGESDLVMLEVVNLAGVNLVRRGKMPASQDRVIEADINIEGQSYGRVRFALSDAVMKREQASLLTWVTFIGVVTIVFSVVVFALIGHMLTGRLRDLALQADRIAQGDFHVSLPEAGRDEVGHLSHAFGVMARALKQRFEELTEAKSAAEAASKSKSNFLANMSHEFRTPLHGIIGLSEIALRKAVDDRQRDQLSKVIKSATHLNTIVTDVLDIARLDTGAVQIGHAVFQFESLASTLHAMYGAEAEKKDLAFHIQIAPEVAHLRLMGDAPHIVRILSNLVANAIKFTMVGQVAVHIHSTEDLPGRARFRFEVRDTGIGISPDDVQRVLEAFEQADGSMTRHYGGTGLGLSISIGLVRLMGGEFGVESKVGIGSLFWFELTLDKAD